VSFETKDSGVRAEFASGMVRDTENGKARFDLLLPLGIPYEEQMLTRDAQLMARGAEKYEARNWEKANGEAELARYRSSALRHLMQWIAGERDEDHAAAVRFNIMAGEAVAYKMRQPMVKALEHAAQGMLHHMYPPSGYCDVCYHLLPEHAIDCPRFHEAD